MPRTNDRLDPFYGAARARVLPRLLDVLAPRPCLACARLVEPASRGVLGLCRRCHGRLRPAAARPRCTLCGASIRRGGRGGHAGTREASGKREASREQASREQASREQASRQHCGDCRASTRPPWTSLTFGWVYAPPLDAVVAALKFRRLEALGERLGRAAVAALAPPTPLDTTPFEPDPVELVTWVPLHWRRRLGRGFDQAEEVAHGVAASLDLPCAPLLRRRRATPPQSLEGRAARLENLSDAFRPRRRPHGRPIPARALLVDDVVTTGATLATAARALRAAGVRRVDLFAVARAPARPVD